MIAATNRERVGDQSRNGGSVSALGKIGQFDSWVPLISAVELPLAESQRRRLKDVLEYQKNRQTFLR
jgi:hypothetical protein